MEERSKTKGLQYDSVIYISIYYWSTFINGMKGYTSSITALHGSSCAEYMYIYFQNDNSVSITKRINQNWEPVTMGTLMIA